MKKCVDILNEKRNTFVNALIKTPGFLHFIVLHILHRKPLHGRAIRKEIENLTQHKLIIGPANIYPLLKEMESEGLLSGRWDMSGIHPRRVYSITESGKEVYKNSKLLIGIKLKELTEVAKKIEMEVFDERRNGK